MCEKGYKNELRPSGLLRLRFDNWFGAPIRREWLETRQVTPPTMIAKKSHAGNSNHHRCVQ
jgi:hypothetical protein